MKKASLFFLLISAGCILVAAYIYIKKKRSHIGLPPLVSAQAGDTANINSNFFFDLETTVGLNGIDNIKPAIAHSGKMACDLTGGKEFGFSVIKKMSDVGNFPMKKTSASIWIYPLTEHPNVVLTASISNSKSETVFWDGKSTEKQDFPKNKWTKINALYNFPVEKLGVDDVLQINIWNKGKSDVIVDDLEVVYGESNERRGIYSGVDANLFYDHHFVPQKNKPPFPVLYLEKQEMNNNNGTLLIANDQASDLSPNDELFAGNFIDLNNDRDQLVCIKDRNMKVFLYNTEKHEFQLHIEINESNDLSKEIQKFAGDFNVDGKADVLLVNPAAKSWKLMDLKNKTFEQVSAGNFNGLKNDWFSKGNKISVSNLFSAAKNDALVMLSNTHCYTLGFDKQSNNFIEQTLPLSSDSGLFNAASVIYSGVYNGSRKQELLKYESDWRFDLKLINKTTEGFIISNAVDFKGYPNDCNPKYYEFVKIIPGKFISSARLSALVVMRNCADVDFNGNYCKQFENLSYLPNSVQLYSIEK
jgi:hypothetical protein